MKKRIFGAPTIPAAESDSEGELQPTYARRPRAHNLYQHLSVEDGADSESEPDASQNAESSGDAEEAPPARPAVHKKKKKKKNKNKPPADESDEVETVARAVEAMLGSPAAAPAPRPAPAAVPDVLRLDRLRLNVVREIRHNYEVDVLREFDNPPERKRSGWSRRTTFVQQKKGWRPVRNTDLHMELVRTDAAGVRYFSLVHGASYRRTQLAFLAIVFGDNRPALEQLCADHPHHIDSLLLIAHVDGMLKRYAESKENIEYALFTLEHVFHKDFDYASGTCRLEYKHYENRAFHILLLKLVRYHYNLACHRTALELCKLLLLLDPTDPLGVTLLIDALALRAGESRWLIKAIEHWDRQHRALSLPNMSFAYALAHYNTAIEDGENTERAEQLLEAAITRAPSVVVHLLERCGSQRRDILSLPLYRDRSDALDGPVLWCLCRLTAERQFPVWKRPATLSWLERAAAASGERRPQPLADRGRRAVFRRAPPQLLRNLTVLNHSRVPPPDTDPETRPFPVTDPHPPPDGLSPYDTAANPYWRATGVRHQPFNPLQFLNLG